MLLRKYKHGYLLEIQRPLHGCCLKSEQMPVLSSDSVSGEAIESCAQPLWYMVTAASNRLCDSTSWYGAQKPGLLIKERTITVSSII
jgi:hypothetical protein